MTGRRWRSWPVLAVVAILIGASAVSGLAAWPTGPTRGPACSVPSPVDVVLDPGHGGPDRGARNAAHGLIERDFTLEIARQVAVLLEADGTTVTLTRDDNTTSLGNGARGMIANACGARLFVSIHLNSVSSPTPNYALTLWAVTEKDRALARVMHAALTAGLRPGTNLSDGGIKTFDSEALLRAQMPAVLVEPVFLSNPEEAARLASGDGARVAQVAAAIASGVRAGLALPAPTVVAPAPTSAPLPDPPGGLVRPAADPYRPVLPAHRDAVAAATTTLSSYQITATLTPTEGAGTIIGTVDLHYHNITERGQSVLYLRLYPNDERFAEGGLVLGEVRVDGVPVVPGSLLPAPPLPAWAAGGTPRGADSTVTRIPLPRPVPPGGTTAVTMAFTTTVPVAPSAGPGTFGVYPDTGTWVLADWFPLLAGYDTEAGWELASPAPWADPVFANTARFDVSLTVPATLVLATTGVQVAASAVGDRVRRHYVSGPAREFAVMADDNYATARRRVGDTTVTAFFTPDHAEGGEQILTYAAQVLEVYNELFGPYPYAELDVVAVPSTVGFEFPQLVVIGTEFYDDPAHAGSRVGAVEFLVAHEVAHQWWYSLVGSNPSRHAFLDEGLAEDAATLYFGRQHGAASAEQQVNLGLRLRYATMIFTGGDHIVDQPSAAFPDELTYYTTVYRKAALGFAALRLDIGDAAFFNGLRTYAEGSQFGVATPTDLRTATMARAMLAAAFTGPGSTRPASTSSRAVPSNPTISCGVSDPAA